MSEFTQGYLLGMAVYGIVNLIINILLTEYRK